jgi:hypothetical protein
MGNSTLDLSCIWCPTPPSWFFFVHSLALLVPAKRDIFVECPDTLNGVLVALL